MDAIACTLSVDELPRRAAEIGELARHALLGMDRGERSVELRFAPDAGTLARIEALVAAESRCCAFLGFAIDRRADATALTITAPAGAEPALEELAGMFA
ncbi:MAG: hypothetical protein QOH58_2707 [Thermoleophilaceae bacterium]|jgi:hypothetical protein|nr:hypothetical protein [Thermoleophilaceae bacterium]